MTTTIDHTAEKSRSYSVRIPAGSGLVARLRRDAVASRKTEDGEYERRDIPAGTKLYPGRYGDTNAGFRGIEVTLPVGDGFWLVGLSTGALDLVDP
jgi:hypothetical protein